MKKRTLIELFQESLKKYSDNPLIWEKKDSSYQELSYREVGRMVEVIGGGFIAIGIAPGDRVALISEGRSEWIASELAVLHTGGICVPLSVKIDEASQLKFRLNHSQCRYIVLSSCQLEKTLSISHDLPFLEGIILMDPLPEYTSHPLIISMESLRDTGRDFLREHPGEFEGRYSLVGEEDPANICYTSGTTGDPKGIILTHKNYYVNIRQASEILPIPQWYSSLLILPWDHSFAHTAGIYTLIKNGASMAAVQLGSTPMETLRNIPENICECRPTFLLSVPSLAQKFQKNICREIERKGPLAAGLFSAALSLAYIYNGRGDDRGRGGRALLKPLIWIFDRILFSRIREGFGGRLEFLIGGGSLLDIDIQRFFYAIGIPIYQGYGLSEAAPIISANVPSRHRLGSSGTPVRDLNLKICSPSGTELPPGHTGEILVRGENIMAGYWKNPEATERTLKEGWLHTGDLGYLDGEGFLYVTGREKSLLIGDDGEKYSPEGIEEALVSHSPYIEQVLIYNNQSPYTSALIVPNTEEIIRRLSRDAASPLDFTDPSVQDRIIALMEKEVKTFRDTASHFPRRWTPSVFILLDEGFTQENHLLNSTMKMVRKKVHEVRREEIDCMYTPEGRSPYNPLNRRVVSEFSSLKTP